MSRDRENWKFDDSMDIGGAQSKPKGSSAKVEVIFPLSL
jgi:hypothetical protein